MIAARRISGHHVLIGFIAFFATIFAANGTFVYYALATHPGDDVKDAYAGGLKFNRELAEKRAQEKLGWQAEISVVPGGSGQIIELAFRDSRGNAVGDLTLSALLRDPVNAAGDRAIQFVPIGDGRFRAEIDVPRTAQRDLVVEARSAGGNVFRLSHRL